MLCEEQGFFLEIADLIRGLGLTILKGVMEARNDKIWARFAVEVIFKSLLYLELSVLFFPFLFYYFVSDMLCLFILAIMFWNFVSEIVSNYCS